MKADLLAVAANSLVSPLTEECVCVVGDIERQEVSLVSAQQVRYVSHRETEGQPCLSTKGRSVIERHEVRLVSAQQLGES